MSHVWYACYGSNINTDRFMKYISECDDKTSPLEEKEYEFNHNIYFAGKSKIWEGKAVAFLDDTRLGHAYGKLYKITMSQFKQVYLQEGEAYKKELYLGELNGLPVYTFTSPKKRSDSGVPSDDYFFTILDGLQKLYKTKSYDELKAYLGAAVQSDNFKTFI